MTRIALVLPLLATLATACTVKETYNIPDEALHTLTTIDRTRLDKIAVPGRRGNIDGPDEYVKASTFDLNNASGVQNDRVNVATSEKQPLTPIIAGAVLIAAGGAGLGVGGWMSTDDPSHGGEYIGGLVLLAAGAAMVAAGGGVLLWGLLRHPQEVNEGNAGFQYLDPTGRIPQGGAALPYHKIASIGLHF